MIAAGAQPQGTQIVQPNSGGISPVGVGSYYSPSTTNYSIKPQSEEFQKQIFEYMKKKDSDQMGLATQAMKWNGGLQAGKLAAETLTKSLDSTFTHVANMKQLGNYETYLNNQHDIAIKSIGLESKKLDVQKEMQNDQLRYQLKVAQYGKEKDVTIAAIHEKGKTKRVQALAALRDIYGRGKPVSPFQNYMT